LIVCGVAAPGAPADNDDDDDDDKSEIIDDDTYVFMIQWISG